MHTYLFLEQEGLWVVGLWPSPQPMPLFRVRTFEHEGEAAAYCSYLNGGAPPLRLLMRCGLHPDHGEAT